LGCVGSGRSCIPVTNAIVEKLVVIIRKPSLLIINFFLTTHPDLLVVVSEVVDVLSPKK